MTERRLTPTSAGVYLGNDTTVETMSDFFRPVSTTLPPHWEHAASQVYSTVSMTSSHDEVSSHSSTLKSDQDSHSGDHYNTYNGAGVGEEHLQFTGTSPLSVENPGEEFQADDGDAPPRKMRKPVPNEKKDNKYWDRRKKNNQAAKRSRDTRKKRMEDEMKSAKEAITENQKLKQEIDVLKSEINSLRRLLKDANMTLSLWIKARQASEPNTQLPPMLRGPNLSFVNFPVTTI